MDMYESQGEIMRLFHHITGRTSRLCLFPMSASMREKDDDMEYNTTSALIFISSHSRSMARQILTLKSISVAVKQEISDV